jgi:hypothetical protein
VNINFGPAASRWYCVSTEHVARLRSLVKMKFGDHVDIHKQEGCWFEEVDFFLANNIPISYFYQKAGDCVKPVFG